MSFAVGIGAGLAVGMGAGIVAGRKKASDDLRRYARVRHMTIHDDEGQAASIDEFVEQALTTHIDKNQKALLLVGSQSACCYCWAWPW